MTTIINGSSPSVTFSDGTTQATAGLTAANPVITSGSLTFADASTQASAAYSAASIAARFAGGGTSGYQKLPSGLVIQWGSCVSSVKTSFPITFPNAINTVTGTVWYSSAPTTATQLDWGNTDATGVTFLASQGGVLLSSQTIFYIAIGY